MQVKVLASGSDGNCVWLGNGEVGILVDAGLQKSKIEKILLENEIDPTELDAVFLTHEHGDHVRGLSFADKYKIPIHASEGTLKKLNRLDTGKQIGSGKWYGFDALRLSFMTVSAFSVSHDAADPLGYTIRSRDRKVSVLMDTGTVTEDMLAAMADSDVYVFECNHDLDMLLNGDYHDGLKARVQSDLGHLSNDQAAEALARLIRGHGEMIYLTHMSANNNLPALAAGTVKRALRARGLIAGQHYHLEVI